MRELLILRGLPGSGKSTLIKEMGLEAYTLSTDDLRKKLGSLEQTFDSIKITQDVERETFKLLDSLLDARMSRGEFTVVDATHINSKSCSRYRKLAEKCNYKLFYYQLDTSLEECLKRNRERKTYSIVPDSVITGMAERFSDDLGDGITRVYDLREFISEIKIDKLKGYTGAVIVGDIHSCATPLKSLLKDFKDDFKYVFLGDCFDRGIEAYETWRILNELSKKPNVVMVLGNHERHILRYCNNEEVKSKSSIETFNELEKHGVTKEELREFYNRFVEYYCFTIFNKTYFCCHGGLSYIPENLKLTSLATFATGVGSYEAEIDDIYKSNFEKGMCRGFIQVHGHRRTTSNEFSYCLEGGVENGGNLVHLGIRQNKVYVGTIRNKIRANDSGYKLDDALINKIVNTTGVYTKELDDNIISVNFSRAVFESKVWNDTTTKARGLFVDKTTGEVVARSYDKFFNLGEMEETMPYSLSSNLKFPVTLREKANGFLGIVSMFNGNVKFFSKTSDKSEHVRYIKDCWDLLQSRTKHALINIMVKHNCSIVFEVIHHEDPHIVEYDKDCLYLLDFIENNIETKFLDIDFDLKDSRLIRPRVFGTAKSYKELMEMLEKIHKLKGEGVVCRDANNFMFKYKTEWYNTWKLHRKTIDTLKKGKKSEYDREFASLLEQRPELLDMDLYSLRDTIEKEQRKANFSES